MPSINAFRNAVKNFGVKQRTIDRETGDVNANKLATFTEKASRNSKRGYVKKDYQLSTNSFSFHAGLVNYLKNRGAKKEQVGDVGRLNMEQLAFIDAVKSVARAGRALNDNKLNSSIQFILNGRWESEDAYRITPDLAQHVRNIADALDRSKLDAAMQNKPAPALPNMYAIG